jgi:alpha-D-ribose 1-methylphosphonate 5-phosphate C-P lyase
VDTTTANVVDIWNTRHRIPVKSPENSTTYVVLLSARLRHLCPHQQVSHTVWSFEGYHGRRRKVIVLFGLFFDGCPKLTNGVEAVS